MIWKDVKGLENNYKISNTGLLYSKKFKRILKTSKDGNGYLSFHSITNYGEHILRIHRLVATHFLEYIEGKNYVNHKDGNKINNNVDNLEWCTPSENTKHSLKTKLSKIEKPVYQLKDGKIINEFVSIREAARRTGIDNRRICHNLKKHIKQTDGYTWEYKDVLL